VRKWNRIDANQTETVKALRQAGCSVAILSSIGRGIPDLLVGRNGKNILLELKDGSLSPARRALSVDEQKFVVNWRGQVGLAESPAEAVSYVLANS
jgi:hypothetical protein